MFTAVRVAAFAADEADRRLTLLYAQPVTRRAVAVAEAATTAGGTVLLAVAAGTTTWIGTAIVGAGLGPPAALAGVANGLPVAALCLGAAVLALGVAPRLAAGVAVAAGTAGVGQAA